MRRGINECDQLRLPDSVCEPDSRTHFYVNYDKRTEQTSPKIIKNQYEAVACFVLNDTVPENITIHFETAKNLYLYAWFVYRFYPVAEQQALASLEFALRERFPDFVESERKKRPKSGGPGLWMLLDHAIKNGSVRNDMFAARERWAWRRAEIRHSFEKMQEMMAAGIESMGWSESEVVVTQEDLECDWLRIFQENIPKIRIGVRANKPAISKKVRNGS
jgi:hypothetical protein